MKAMKHITTLFLFLGIALMTQAYSQTTTWKFSAGDNSGYMARITTNGSGEITKIELGKVGDAAWTATEIQKIDDYQEYAVVKSAASGRVYELYFSWAEDKMTMVKPEGDRVIYWLVKS